MMKHSKSIFVWAILGVIGASLSAAEPQSDLPNSPNSERDRPTLLLVDQEVEPTVHVSWVIDGQRQGFDGVLPYTAPSGGDPIAKNVKCYVTLGGTRIETGAGHPKGAVIRLGVTKIENARAFFSGIQPGTDIEFAILGVEFNQPVKYHEGTGLMHLKYAIGDLIACALPATARNQYLLSDPEDTLGGRVTAGENASPGALDGEEDHGDITIEINEENPKLVDMRIRVPYGYLRHLQDPWKSTLPGTFFEPVHLHAEAELIPIDAEPLDRDPILPEVNTKTNQADENAELEPESDSES